MSINRTNKSSKTINKENNIFEENKENKENNRNIYSKFKEKLDPIKLIYKYNNNNHKNQYIMYIFVGKIGKRHINILKKIEKLNLHDTLLVLSSSEEKELIEAFGDLWMIKFFNIYHISAFINKLENNPKIKKDLLKKYDENWITNFINKFKNNIIFKKINYSYSDLIKLEYKNMMGKKLDKIILTNDDIIFDQKNTSNSSSSNILYQIPNLKNKTGGYNIENNKNINLQTGGENDDMINNEEELEDEFEEELDDETIFDPDSVVLSDVVEDENIEEDEISDYEDIIKIYQTEEIDKNANNTGTLISNILNDNKIIEKKKTYMVNFDDSHDNDIDNNDLSNVYEKIFIYNHYLFKDDTIKTIKNKICCSIKMNSKFGNNSYLIPSRLYLWSEYIMNNKVEKVMIGQKWIKKNELLNLDIEPLSLNKYYNAEGPIKNLKELLKIYSTKIRREDEDNNILYDYNDYMLNDTIYMIDIYNELGLNFDVNNEQLLNLNETYFKIFFPKIKNEDINDIISFLNKKDNKNEETRIKNTFDTIYNDMVIEKEITELIEETKYDKKDEYLPLFESGNFIVQSQIQLNLIIYDDQLEEENKENLKILNKTTGEYGTIFLPKLDLFRIFNDFTADDEYPFIQYQIPGGEIIFKYNDDYMYEFSKSKYNIDIITKWFENSPSGLSFKVKLNSKNNAEDKQLLDHDKFMGINIDEIGKVNFKTQWKEEDSANIDDVIYTYNYIKKLIVKINSTLINHPRKISIKVPEDYEFRFSFINCIQKFNLPDSRIIDHNDFSDFCIFFFPYISLVIEPRKRHGKLTSAEVKSKYGSYLRYKRVSKFENQAKIEYKILSYMKNYDFEDDILAEEISKQFNITSEKAKEEITRVRSKFPAISKNIKSTLKVTEELPKQKAPGIGIDIQGKIPEKYRIRISGAKNQDQLERILVFMNILLYLYSQTYLLKNPKYQIIKEKLKKLTNIARRRNKVNDVIIINKETKAIKQMSQIDKKRIGFTPEEGMSQYSRYCQNSGDDKKRRPLQTVINNITTLISNGYKLNKKTNEYEKKVILKKGSKNGKNSEIVLKAIKISDKDDTSGVVNDIFYTCDPKDNGEHMYVGFLTRSNNPFGECMPCCFKKNPLDTKKKEKQEFFKKCLSGRKEVLKEGETESGFIGDILYILQDTNKIQEGRIAYLPKYIDAITNLYLNKKKEVKNHYLLRTDSFYFKYGINQENYSFLNTLSSVLKMTILEIKNHIIDFFKKDVDENYYISLNDGDIRAEYKINDFIRFINDEQFIDYYYLKDILKIKGLFTEMGILPIVFNKSMTIIKTGVEKDKIKEDFYLLIDKSNVLDFKYYLDMFNNKDILILIKDGKFYYPLIEITKKDNNSKEIIIKKLFNKYDKKDKEDIEIINLIEKFYIKTVDDINTDYNKIHCSARETFILLNKIADNEEKNNKFKPTHQIIDSRYKTKYILTKNNYIIPVVPSGIIDNIPIICMNTLDNNKFDCFSKLKFYNIEETNYYLEQIYNLTEKKINIKPIGLFYDKIDDNNMVNIIGIITSNNDFVPITSIQLSKEKLDSSKIIYQHRPLYHELDQKLAVYDKNYFNIIDQRIKNVNKTKYIDEAYQLFKFELSNILSNKNYIEFKTQIKEYIKKKDSLKIQNIINSICINKVNNKIFNKDNMVSNELVKIIKELPNLDYYKVNNQRNICSTLDKDKCNINPHCQYIDNKKVSKCSFVLTDNLLIQFIKRLSIELVEQEIKAYELLKEKKYYVSDIVDYNNFTEKNGQKIIKSSNTNLQKILTNIFGKEHIPKIGRRFLNKKLELNYNSLQLEYPLKDIKDAYVQNIISYNYSILRAYINGFYWIKHDLYTIDNRNLGYYSDLQNELVNMFRSLIIDWLNIPNNIDLLINLDDKIKNIIKNKILFLNENNRVIINNYIVKFMDSNTENNLGLFELFILSNINSIPVVILVNNIVKYYINNNNIIDNINDNNLNIKNNESTNELKYLNRNNICINLDISNENIYPNIVEIIYYK
jgi:hypothetical protein